MRLKLSLLCLITTLLFFGSFVLKANAISSADILVSISPQNPAPNENVNITIKSYAYDLNSVLISWSLNGKTMSSGIGKKSFSFTTGKAGEEMSVIANASLPDGVVSTKITIKPSIMVLLWQANDSYVPPFYKGKALPTSSSEVKVVAMPEIRSSSGYVSAQNMVYSWKKDYTNNVDGSGYGKDSFLFVNDYLEDSNNISVTVSTIDQKNSSDASITIGTAEPKILFYKNDSNIGTIWEKMLTNPYKMQNREIVEAVPYFISPKELRNPTLVWSWFINDNRVTSTSLNKNLMPLEVKTGTHGTSKLRLNITNTDKILQAEDKEINIEF
jgi:hypothetical protein